MSDLIRETAVPLIERAVRRDGTLRIKMIRPGWGSSGYYGREVLERDIPRAFPAGTQMFWNHDTVTEEAERPEGDLARLAAVTTSAPVWEDDDDGGGMYADVRPFLAYRETIDDIGGHIGVSIRGLGSSHTGEAEGREGRIIDEIVAGKSVDFVTVPGAGGRIVQIFEAAGRGDVRAQTVREAQNIGEWLESRLHLRLTEIADELYGDGRISREERKAMSSAIGTALDAYRADLMANAAPLFQRRLWSEGPDSEDIAAMNSDVSETTRPDAAINHLEDAMSEEQLQEAQAALAEANETIARLRDEVARLREQSLLRAAQDFVVGRLVEADLPAVTRVRLTRQLTRDFPTADGRIDETAYGERVDAAVTEAQAEIAAITGRDGQIRGMGNGAPAQNGMTLDEARKEQQAILAELGYGGE